MGITDYDGCGKCFVGVVRLSRVTDSTDSPEKQCKQTSKAVDAVGGHIIGWASDLEVSGATDPLTRPELGPWLRGEMGPYSGIASSAVDRIGRNVLDVLNTAANIKNSGRLLVTYGHDGPWNLDDQNDENLFTFQAMGAQQELRAIQRRIREAKINAREMGVAHNKNSYGYRFVRLTPTGRIHHVEIDPEAAAILRDVADRILSDESGTVTAATEAARLNRAGVLSPSDHRAVVYGREPAGHRWTARTLTDMLISPAALGFLLHQGRPVIGPDGHPRRIAPELWDRATHEALIAKTAPKRTGSRAPRGARLLSGRAFCGTCGEKLYIASWPLCYICTARVRGIRRSADCKPAPAMTISNLEAAVTAYFLDRFGSTPVMRRVFDPGSGHAARIASLEADRRRLREDRAAGLFDSDDDAAWFREQYARMGRELDAVRAEPERPAGMRWVMTGRTVADQWREAPDIAARRDLLATYGVKAVLYPRGARTRLWIHALDPQTEADALDTCREADAIDAEEAAALADMLAEEAEATALDPDELAHWDEDDQAEDDLSMTNDAPSEPYDLAIAIP